MANRFPTGSVGNPVPVRSLQVNVAVLVWTRSWRRTSRDQHRVTKKGTGVEQAMVFALVACFDSCCFVGVNILRGV